jgi:hypothetical protein
MAVQHWPKSMTHYGRWAIERMQVDTKTHDLRRAQFRTVLRFKDSGNVTGDITDLLRLCHLSG